MLAAGQAAPDFTLSDQNGREISLKGLRGQKVALYFYPKDDTPGCTKEACSFRDETPRLQAAGVVVLGVSPDSVASHQKFAGKFQLPFSLLADPDHAVAAAYGVWGEKKNYGRTYEGIFRTTFLIDEQGVVSHVFTRPKNEIHAQEVLQKLG